VSERGDVEEGHARPARARDAESLLDAGDRAHERDPGLCCQQRRERPPGAGVRVDDEHRDGVRATARCTTRRHGSATVGA
jgi:hypothetical protein